ncbi:MAG: BBP7 family outer membrane beta-barrel protein [Gemmataceae bacterium]
MRRALISTIAGWLAGAASVLAQNPMPINRGADDTPPPASTNRAPALSPYAQYSTSTQGSAHFDGAAYDQQRRQTMYRPNGQPVNGPGLDGPVMNGPGLPGPRMDGPQFLDCGGRCANGNCDSGCGNQANCRCPCGACGPDGRFWGSGEFLLWWVTGQPLPPLVTTSPAGTPRLTAGRLDQPTTTVLFGGGRVYTDEHPGFRARAGFWLDDCQMIGLEGSFTYLRADFLNNCGIGPCDANSIVTRPFLDVNPAVNRDNTELVCFPGVINGNVTVTGRTDYYGADANLRRNLICSEGVRVDLVGGYRFLSLNDRLQIQENLVSLLAGAVGTTIQVTDRFGTDNRFHGGQIGIAGELHSGRLFLDFRSLVALGASIETVTIAGQTVFTTPGAASVTLPGGLLAQPTNIGTNQTTDFAVVPEVNLNVGVNVTDNLRVFVGYSFIYWSSVVRAGQQIDLTVNSSQLPFLGAPGVLAGPARPAFTFTKSDFYMHGIGFGGQLRF